MRKEKMINIFTVDLEEWFHANYKSLIIDENSTCSNRVVENTMVLLELLDSYRAQATFFVLGYVAQRFPKLIKTISDMGHEIASHGYSHELIYKQNRKKVF
ncbi:polysaccharide deacetylase family protein [Syntrophomonas palmitatica]|uniref:polysaccharide deacetylase family protein n=1 Tax=Syntrophomonas palmitatica TaxID=402877 RepID=UPI001FA7AB37|nr:polysaccharide deacetylase family protein [Syntrophomonas palmitatica]